MCCNDNVKYLEAVGRGDGVDIRYSQPVQYEMTAALTLPSVT